MTAAIATPRKRVQPVAGSWHHKHIPTTARRHLSSITLHDVARLAGVSIKTVSRVLNNEPYVSKDKQERVQAVVEQLNYRPNIAARTLSSAKSYLVGFLAPTGAEIFMDQLLRGALAACQRHAHHLVVEFLQMHSGDPLSKVKALCTSTPLDGAVLAPGVCDSPAVIAYLDKRAIPHVSISPNWPLKSRHVYIDEARAMYELTQHLLQLGHERIAFIGHRSGWPFTERRLQGFLTAMQEAGIKVPGKHIVDGDFSFRSGRECADRVLAKDPRPSAVLAINDEMALGAMVSAYQHGLRIPQDISITGFDDGPLAAVTWPQLTTVRQPMQMLAATAAELLLQSRTADSTAERGVLLPFELSIRGTTARCFDGKRTTTVVSGTRRKRAAKRT